MAKLRTRSGVKLTRKRLKQLAAEAERGYDLSTSIPESVTGGRPSLEDGESPRISFRVGESLYRRAGEKAKREGRTLSDVARTALEKYIDR